MVRAEAGTLLRRLQRGQLVRLPHLRPTLSIGTAGHEFRLNDASHTCRAIYRIDDDPIVFPQFSQRRPTSHPSWTSKPASNELEKGIMDRAKRSRLERAGWRIGSAADFVQLTDEESAYIDLKLTLSELLRTVRTLKGLSQMHFAKLLGSSQSRVAKMEASDRSVSLDLLLRGLLSLGTTPTVLGQAIAATQPRGRDRSPSGTAQPRVTKRASTTPSRPNAYRQRAV